MRRSITLTTALIALLSGCAHRTPASSDLFDEPAAIATGKLPWNPLAWQVISTGIDRRQHTISALYGNDLAIQSARSGQPSYPAGAVLSLVTWTQRDDPHWFGARIPGAVQSVEFVAVGNHRQDAYQRYDGPDLRPRITSEPATLARETEILSQWAAVMP